MEGTRQQRRPWQSRVGYDCGTCLGIMTLDCDFHWLGGGGRATPPRGAPGKFSLGALRHCGNGVSTGFDANFVPRKTKKQKMALWFCGSKTTVLCDNHRKEGFHWLGLLADPPPGWVRAAPTWQALCQTLPPSTTVACKPSQSGMFWTLGGGGRVVGSLGATFWGVNFGKIENGYFQNFWPK